MKGSLRCLHSVWNSSTVRLRGCFIRFEEPRTVTREMGLVPVALVMIALLIVGGLFYRSHKTQVLNEKDSILLSDFTNTTGDPVFDNTLKKALAVSLGQSPYLNVVPDSKVQQTLKLMGKPPETRLTSDIGREICQRAHVKAMLHWSDRAAGE